MLFPREEEQVMLGAVPEYLLYKGGHVRPLNPHTAHWNGSCHYFRVIDGAFEAC